MSDDAIAAMAYARQVFVEQCRAEVAGLFWIGAELAILVAVIAARRDVAARCESAHPQPGIWRVTTLACLGFLALVVVTQLRYLWWTPVHLRLAAGDLGGANALQAAYRFQNHAHYGLWAAFTLAWVVLEAAIVYHGWHVCRGLRAVLTRMPASALVFLAALVALPAHAEGEALLAALRAADLADALYRNALGLWLRVAGVAWIAIEWVAAVLLWRSYRLLARVAAQRSSP